MGQQVCPQEILMSNSFFFESSKTYATKTNARRKMNWRRHLRGGASGAEACQGMDIFAGGLGGRSPPQVITPPLN